jgi:hypothetical protein
MTAPSPHPTTLSEKDAKHPRSVAAFSTVKRLVGVYLGISLLTMVAVFLLGSNTSLVTDTVWVRGTIVAATALLMFAFAVRAARGSRKAYLRVRIMSGVMVVAILVIVLLPGFIPLWMRIEQGVCGLVLIGVVAVVNGKHLRAVFAK